MTMTANQWLIVVTIGIIFGALGQGARVVVGMKKLYDNSSDNNPMSVMIDGARLLISFGIGGIAGAFAAVTLISSAEIDKIEAQKLFAIAAAGYAGSDFIEGFMSRISGSPGKPGPGSPAQGHSQQSSDDAVG
jgi:hypothetical protein